MTLPAEVEALGPAEFTYRDGRTTYLIAGDGIAVGVHNSSWRVTHWHDVAEYYHRQAPRRARRFRLRTRHAEVLNITGRLAGEDSMAGIISATLMTRMLPAAIGRIERGETVRFGPLAATRDGLTFDGKFQEWEELKIRQTKSGKRRWAGMFALFAGIVTAAAALLLRDRYFARSHLVIESRGVNRFDRNFCTIDAGDVPNLGVFLMVVQRLRPSCLS